MGTHADDLPVVGHYRCIAPLGSGGMGDVYLAEDVAPGRSRERVALKLLRSELTVDPDFRHRFAREVAAVRRVQGRSVARVLDADLDAARPWIATEYVPGPTLRQARADAGVDGKAPVAGGEDQLRSLAAGLARALADIHTAGVVHRDLNPSNVILGPDGPKVVDFGIAWFGDATTVTRTGMVLGTPAWMAPEQLGDDRTTAASDVWAWGAVMAFAATGRPPVTGSRPEVMQVRAARGELDLAGVPDWLLGLVQRAMDPDPAGRPTAAALAVELGVPTDVELTKVLDRTWVAAASTRTEAYVVDAGPSVVPAWVWRWAPGAALAILGATFATVAGFLPVVLAVGFLVVVAAGLRIWEVEHQSRPAPRWVPAPGGLVVAALATAGFGLAQVLGPIGGLVALLAIVVFLAAIGAHGG